MTHYHIFYLPEGNATIALRHPHKFGTRQAARKFGVKHYGDDLLSIRQCDCETRHKCGGKNRRTDCPRKAR